MNKLNTLSIGLLSCLSLACVINDDDGGGVDTETGGTSPSTMTAATMTTTTASTTTPGDSTGGGMTMGQTGDETAESTAGETEATSSGTTAVDPGPFVPDDPDPSLYTRVDRMGMPAISTALIPTDDKDAYNNADPSNDTALAFQTDITGSIDALLTALEDDFAALTPPIPTCPDVNQCYNVQANPLIIPDTLKLDLNTAAGFPNGRMLPDQVIDLSLAVLLLDLVPPGETTVDVLANAGINPTANDQDFGEAFPFLADAH